MTVQSRSRPDRDADWQAQITTLEDEANQAFIDRDIGRLEELFSAELVVNSPINLINDKQKILELLENRIIGHVSSTIRHEFMRKDGDLIIVMGSDSVQNSPTEPVLRRRFTNVWRKEGDRWRLYVRHANVIADSAKPRSSVR